MELPTIALILFALVLAYVAFKFILRRIEHFAPMRPTHKAGENSFNKFTTLRSMLPGDWSA